MTTETGIYIFDANGLRQLDRVPSRVPVGAWARSGSSWEQLRMVFKKGYKQYEWVYVTPQRLPKIMRTHLLLTGGT